ncbi:hypothetical protein VE02_08578 [Pseudogymnoascus sp. 03VT05]|nr:hypothetical protein VE02_08578 [Pseudogymnoascus sp. 03VT05]
MTSTGVKKRDSRFFATVLIQDEDEPEQDAADAGRLHANLPIMSAPQTDNTLPAFTDWMQYLSRIDGRNIFPVGTVGSTGIALARFQPHPQADPRDRGKGRMEGSGYEPDQRGGQNSFPVNTDNTSIPPAQFQSQPQADQARDKGKGRMEDVPPQSDSLPATPQAREPTSLGRFLVRMCGKENRERLGRTITAMRRVPDGMLELAHLPWHSPDDPLVQRHIMELCRLKGNMGQVEVIVGTSHLSAQGRKKAVLYALGAIDGELNDNRFEIAWRKFRHYIKLIDLLSDPGAIGDNLAGLAILLPEGFSWIRVHETSLATGESMEALLWRGCLRGCRSSVSSVLS